MKYLLLSSQTRAVLNKTACMEPTSLGAFFFYDQGIESERHFDGFLASLLCQMLQKAKALAAIVKPQYERAAQLRGPDTSIAIWSEALLREALMAIAEQDSVDLAFCFVIDALDECKELSPRLHFLMGLGNPYLWKRVKLKFCIASRPTIELVRRFRQFQTFELSKFTTKDIQQYVTQELWGSLSPRNSDADSTQSSEHTCEVLQDEILRMAEGIFLWVKLVVNELKFRIENNFSEDQLQKTLLGLPHDINALYTAIFAKIPDNLIYDAVKYLEIMRTATENSCPLNLLKFYFATAGANAAMTLDHGPQSSQVIQKSCSFMKRNLISRCRNLIITKELRGPDIATSKVAFLHRTVLEYMNNKDLWQPIQQRAEHHGSTQDPHLSILCSYMCCVKSGHDKRHSPGRTSALEQLFIFGGRVEEVLQPYVTEYIDPFLNGLSRVDPNWIARLGYRECHVSCVALRYGWSRLMESQIQKPGGSRWLEHLLNHKEVFYYEYPSGQIPERLKVAKKRLSSRKFGIQLKVQDNIIKRTRRPSNDSIGDDSSNVSSKSTSSSIFKRMRFSRGNSPQKSPSPSRGSSPLGGNGSS